MRYLVLAAVLLSFAACDQEDRITGYSIVANSAIKLALADAYDDAAVAYAETGNTHAFIGRVDEISSTQDAYKALLDYVRSDHDLRPEVYAEHSQALMLALRRLVKDKPKLSRHLSKVELAIAPLELALSIANRPVKGVRAYIATDYGAMARRLTQ